ncbi:MAG: hypothetical protein QNJ62_08130 [Methyloceanibacter sp.]|nr:hypothetical protein [Methyloceanibacter sp.]
MFRSLIACIVIFGAASPSFATTGPGCLYIVNVADDDVLNMRADASSKAPIVDIIPNKGQGILRLEGKCVPLDRPWGSRWCPMTRFSGDAITKGWVKARFVRDTDCP